MSRSVVTRYPEDTITSRLKNAAGLSELGICFFGILLSSSDKLDYSIFHTKLETRKLSPFSYQSIVKKGKFLRNNEMDRKS